MRALKLFVFGLLGLLGLLRGIEVLLAGGFSRNVVFVLAFGLLFAALFVRELRQPKASPGS